MQKLCCPNCGPANKAISMLTPMAEPDQYICFNCKKVWYVRDVIASAIDKAAGDMLTPAKKDKIVRAARDAIATVVENDKTLVAALEFIANLEPGSQGAYQKFVQARERAIEAIAKVKGTA